VDEPAIDVVAATREALEELLASADGLDDMQPHSIEASIRALREGADAAWGTHVFIERSSGRVIGYGGYAGPPQDGAVELGYSVLPDARGRGVATAAAQVLVERARERGCSRCITADYSHSMVPGGLLVMS
jgi:RimJ/RimL family protein N-acetyltransferase